MGFEIRNHALCRYIEETSVTNVIIPEGVERITADAFLHCKTAVSITLPSSIWEIPDTAFDTCQNLKYLYLRYQQKCIRIPPIYPALRGIYYFSYGMVLDFIRAQKYLLDILPPYKTYLLCGLLEADIDVPVVLSYLDSVPCMLDDTIQYAIEKQFHQAYVILVNHKYELPDSTDTDGFIQQKFKL